MSIFDKWDKNVDTEGLQKDIAEAEANGGQGDYREVPVGTYEVKIDKMEIKECGSEKHAGEPMFTVQFRILEGDFENSCLFMNQLITEGWQIGQVNKFLRSLDVNDTVEFKTYGQYNDMIMDMMESIDGSLEFLLEYGKNKKGYNTFKIKDVYDAIFLPCYHMEYYMFSLLISDILFLSFSYTFYNHQMKHQNIHYTSLH